MPHTIKAISQDVCAGGMCFHSSLVMSVSTSSLHLIAPISVTEWLCRIASYFVIVGCEQLPLILAELKVLISDARQA